MMGLRRGLNTNKCITSCLLQFQSWNWSYSKSVPSINLHSHIRPPLRALDKPSPSSKTIYSETTHWLQQSQKNINHFWKKDMALVKALRQYHFASNVLEGWTQWKFQKLRILHKVLDVIALNMESTGRCLDFHDSTPMDQEFWHQDLDLRRLKAVAVKEVEHLTMVLVLDKDHTHYSDAFGNIFESGALVQEAVSQGVRRYKDKEGQTCLHHCVPLLSTCLFK